MLVPWILAVGVLCSNAALITNLPGQPNAKFNQYSGYYTVGAKKNHQMHYWFVESQNNPAKDPVLVWLTGGPGCSGLSALLTEWGPFMVNPDGATLSTNPYSWNKNASVLTLESPAGVGYSYSTDGSYATGDDQTASENWEALVAFFNEFPQYKTNDFYVTGESYGGIYIPTLVQTILDRQSQSSINIKGFAIGNGCVSGDEGVDSLTLFLYYHNVIDDTTWQKVKSQCCHNNTDDCAFHSFSDFSFCGEFVDNVQNTAWRVANHVDGHCKFFRGGGMNPYNMYSNCVNQGSTVPLRFKLDYERRLNRPLDPSQLSSVPCMNESAVTVYLNRQDVRRAIGIPSSLGQWSICSDLISRTYNRQYDDMSSRVLNAVTTSGLKGMLYNGDVDLACNAMMGQRFSRKLGIPVSTKKTRYNVQGQVGGYHTKYGNNLHFVSVRGAGHMVPTDKPAVADHIIQSFIFDRPF